MRAPLDLTKTDRVCDTCDHWKAPTGVDPELDPPGECRRQPPQLELREDPELGSKTAFGWWPACYDSDWCGEWSKRRPDREATEGQA